MYNFFSNKFYLKLLYLFVSMSFVTILIHVPGIKLLGKAALVWGMILILFTVFNDYRERKLYKFDIPLIIFIIITLVYNILFYRSMENMKVWIVDFMLFTCIFSINVFKNRKDTLREMNIITYCYTLFMFLASIVAIILKFSGKVIEIGDHVFGMEQGIFINPNALSIACAIAILLSIYLLLIYPIILFFLFAFLNCFIYFSIIYLIVLSFPFIFLVFVFVCISSDMAIAPFLFDVFILAYFLERKKRTEEIFFKFLEIILGTEQKITFIKKRLLPQ